MVKACHLYTLICLACKLHPVARTRGVREGAASVDVCGQHQQAAIRRLPCGRLCVCAMLPRSRDAG